MKILNRKEFLSLPEGVLFQKYHPCIFGDLSIKGESWENDFWYTSLNDNVDTDSSDELFDTLDAALEKGTSFRMNYNCYSRDGLFDNNQLFVVYDKEDVERLFTAVYGVFLNMLKLERTEDEMLLEKIEQELLYAEIPWLRYLHEEDNNG